MFARASPVLLFVDSKGQNKSSCLVGCHDEAKEKGKEHFKHCDAVDSRFGILNLAALSCGSVGLYSA